MESVEKSAPAGKRKASDMLIRFAIGIPLGAVFVCLFTYGNLLLLIGVMVGGWIAMREFWHVAGVKNTDQILSLPKLAEFAGLMVLWASWANPDGSLEIVLAIFLPALLIAQLFVRARIGKAYLHDVAQVLLGILYICGFLSFLFRLRYLETVLVSTGEVSFANGFFTNPNMIHLTIFPVLISWGYDTCALISGKYFGREKLAPTISPKKTVLGLVGGLVGCTAGVLVYAWLIGLIPDIPVWKLTAFGIIGGGISQFGDLTVSALKRDSRLKDSSRLLGVHGGVLDRIDAFLFALPVSYIFFLMV